VRAPQPAMLPRRRKAWWTRAVSWAPLLRPGAAHYHTLARERCCAVRQDCSWPCSARILREQGKGARQLDNGRDGISYQRKPRRPDKLRSPSCVRWPSNTSAARGEWNGGIDGDCWPATLRSLEISRGRYSGCGTQTGELLPASAYLVLNFRNPAPRSPRGVLANATQRRFPLRLGALARLEM